MGDGKCAIFQLEAFRMLSGFALIPPGAASSWTSAVVQYCSKSALPSFDFHLTSTSHSILFYIGRLPKTKFGYVIPVSVGN